LRGKAEAFRKLEKAAGYFGGGRRGLGWEERFSSILSLIILYVSADKCCDIHTTKCQAFIFSFFLQPLAVL
jgi:hypothetical protein